MVFSNLRSQKRPNDCSGILGKRVYQITVNCNIHLGFDNEREINQGISVRAGNLLECCVQCITGIRRQTRLPTDKGLKPKGVSLYIRDGTGSTSPY